MSNKVCMLSIGHSIKDDRIFFKEARSLAKAGYDVQLLFLVASDGFARDMSGKVLNPGKENQFQIEGIKVLTVKRSSSFIDKYFKKVFMASYQKELIQKGIELNADVYHCHEPESLYLGYKICEILKESKLVLDAHESWVRRGIKSTYIRNRIIPKLKYLISANQLTRGYLMNLNYRMKSEVIYNSAVFQHDVKSNLSNSTPFKIVHEGTLKFNRGLKLMLETIKKLKAKGFDFEWHFLGHVPKEESAYMDQFVKDNDLGNFLYLKGNLDYEDLPEALNGFDLGIVASTPESNNYLAGPANKLFNYVAAGFPVLALDIPETTRLVERYRVGKIIKKANLQNLMDGIIEAHANSKTYLENIRENQKEFLWDKEEKKLLKFYSDYLIS